MTSSSVSRRHTKVCFAFQKNQAVRCRVLVGESWSTLTMKYANRTICVWINHADVQQRWRHLQAAYACSISLRQVIQKLTCCQFPYIWAQNIALREAIHSITFRLNSKYFQTKRKGHGTGGGEHWVCWPPPLFWKHQRRTCPFFQANLSSNIAVPVTNIYKGKCNYYSLADSGEPAWQLITPSLRADSLIPYDPQYNLHWAIYLSQWPRACRIRGLDVIKTKSHYSHIHVQLVNRQSIQLYNIEKT